MKNRIILSLLAVSYFWGAAPALVSQIASATEGPVSVAWQLHIDDPSFDFSALRILVHYRTGKYHNSTTLPPVTPDVEGRFTATIPSGNWVSVEVGTSDPTVQSHGIDSYTMYENIRQTVLREEWYLEPGPTRNVERVLRLGRGSAYRICVPTPLKSGYLRLHRRLKGITEGIELQIEFNDPKSLAGAWVGGLAPANWTVRYLEANGEVVSSQDVQLSRGERSGPECP